ncbi:hypothetical protein B484DRAFT_221550 [Ochromonadaceae sp. CCMP2298]|nr:hypothetical protein B484DRAFT_221550 [Ochromonadaceae sp. CCMP2298]
MHPSIHSSTHPLNNPLIHSSTHPLIHSSTQCYSAHRCLFRHTKLSGEDRHGAELRAVSPIRAYCGRGRGHPRVCGHVGDAV